MVMMAISRWLAFVLSILDEAVLPVDIWYFLLKVLASLRSTRKTGIDAAMIVTGLCSAPNNKRRSGVCFSSVRYLMPGALISLLGPLTCKVSHGKRRDLNRLDDCNGTGA